MAESAKQIQSLVLFRIDNQRYALPLKSVERIIRAAAVTPVPETPSYVLGLINITGKLLPVISLRRCLGLPDHAIRPEDQFVVSRTSRLTMVLVVDEVQGLNEVEIASTVSPGEIMPGSGGRVSCMVKINGDIILIYDLDKLFSHEEQERIMASQITMLVGDEGESEGN